MDEQTPEVIPQTETPEKHVVTSPDNTNFGKLVKLMAEWNKIHPDSGTGIRSVIARIPRDRQLARAKAKKHRDMCMKRAKAARKRNRNH